MTDDRATLVKFGFDTGDYVCRCADCGLQFQGAKRSWRCRPCADEAVRGRAHTDDSANAPRTALVERVNDIISMVFEGQGITETSEGVTDLIRAEVLEEAARVAEGPVYRTSGTTGEVSIRGKDGGNWSVPMPQSGFKGSDYGTGRYDAAAAIRALKEKA